MARFYTDHDVSVHTAVALRDQGHDVVTSRELRHERAADYLQLLTAAEQGRILITHNEEDFALLHGAWILWSKTWRVERRHAGALIIPPWRPTLSEWTSVGAAHELAEFVRSHPSLTNELHIWRGGIGWQPVHA